MNLKRKVLNSKPNDFIGAFYLENIQVCDDLIKYFSDNPGKQNPGISRLNTPKGPHVGVHKEIKDSIDIQFTPIDRIPCWNLYQHELEKVISEYKQLFPKSAESALWKIKDYTGIQFYPPGGGYHTWHSERLSAGGMIGSRHLVFMTYLNDVTDAGETEFYHQEIKVKPEKGLTLIWPADWTHYHRGIPSPTQEKYIITGWLNFVS